MAIPLVFGLLLLVIGSLGAIMVKFPGVDTLAHIGTEQVGTTGISLWRIIGIIAASIVLLWLLGVSKMLVARQQMASRHSGAVQADAASKTSDDTNDTATPAIDCLSLQVQRRQQLRAWLEEDPTLGQLVDQSISQQVTSWRRRLQLLALLLGITCLLAGWLLTGLTPSLAQLLRR